jgi:hypothetical protein
MIDCRTGITSLGLYSNHNHNFTLDSFPAQPQLRPEPHHTRNSGHFSEPLSHCVASGPLCFWPSSGYGSLSSASPSPVLSASGRLLLRSSLSLPVLSASAVPSHSASGLPLVSLPLAPSASGVFASGSGSGVPSCSPFALRRPSVPFRFSLRLAVAVLASVIRPSHGNALWIWYRNWNLGIGFSDWRFGFFSFVYFMYTIMSSFCLVAHGSEDLAS